MASFTLRPNIASGVGHYSARREAKFVFGGSFVVPWRSDVQNSPTGFWTTDQFVALQFSAQRDRAPAAVRSTVITMVRVVKERAATVPCLVAAATGCNQCLYVVERGRM
jgi:hypothetical protein